MKSIVTKIAIMVVVAGTVASVGLAFAPRTNALWGRWGGLGVRRWGGYITAPVVVGPTYGGYIPAPAPVYGGYIPAPAPMYGGYMPAPSTSINGNNMATPNQGTNNSGNMPAAPTS